MYIFVSSIIAMNLDITNKLFYVESGNSYKVFFVFSKFLTNQDDFYRQLQMDHSGVLLEVVKLKKT